VSQGLLHGGAEALGRVWEDGVLDGGAVSAHVDGDMTARAQPTPKAKPRKKPMAAVAVKLMAG